MYILAFETSCDDTSCAIFEDDKLLSLKTYSQIEEHNKTKWVVPEVAARLHANNIFAVLDEVFEWTNLKIDDINYIVCTKEPGLLPSLLVGLTVSKTIWKLLNKPVIYVNHIKAHIFANYLERKEEDIIFPSLCLTVSGWHNEIYLWKSMFEFELLGESLDDASGEAFDKVAKMLDLWYPGWPIVSKIASEYTWVYNQIFPRVLLYWDNSSNFSFSWLKSAVKREIDSRIAQKWELTLEDKKEICFEFEQIVVDILKTRIFEVCKKNDIKSIVIAWGVSANNKLKDEIMEKWKELWYNVVHPVHPRYSQDNAAMIWIYWYYLIKYWKNET